MVLVKILHEGGKKEKGKGEFNIFLETGRLAASDSSLISRHPRKSSRAVTFRVKLDPLIRQHGLRPRPAATKCATDNGRCAKFFFSASTTRKTRPFRSVARFRSPFRLFSSFRVLAFSHSRIFAHLSCVRSASLKIR